MSDKLVVPRRKVRKNWHAGLSKDPVDRSHPDVHDDRLVQEAAEMGLLSSELCSPYISNILMLFCIMLLFSIFLLIFFLLHGNLPVMRIFGYAEVKTSITCPVFTNI